MMMPTRATIVEIGIIDIMNALRLNFGIFCPGLFLELKFEPYPEIKVELEVESEFELKLESYPEIEVGLVEVKTCLGIGPGLALVLGPD